MEKKFKAQDKLARRAERKTAQENGTFHVNVDMDDSSDDDENEDDSED